MTNIITYFELKIETANPSADMLGGFETEEEAKEMLEEKLEVIKKDPSYYGDITRITYEITEKKIYLGKENFG